MFVNTITDDRMHMFQKETHSTYSELENGEKIAK